MKRVILLKQIGRHKVGTGIEVEDAVALMWQSQGIATLGNTTTPLKKRDLSLYENCTPLTPAEVAAKMAAAQAKKAAKPE